MLLQSVRNPLQSSFLATWVRKNDKALMALERQGPNLNVDHTEVTLTPNACPETKLQYRVTTGSSLVPMHLEENSIALIDCDW